MSTSEKITKGFFWFAFGAFLAMSIPHVAYIFRFYEPQHDRFDGAWWAVSYGVAVGIDLLICWLSYTRSDQQQTTKTDSAITWLFIVLLAALSWYCNWLFAELMIGVNVWPFVLPMDWTVGSITPLIVSAIPVFLIAYTYMSKRILGKTPKTVEALKAEADRLENIAKEQARIDALQPQKTGVMRRIGATIKEAKDVYKDAFSDGNNVTAKEPTSEQENILEVFTGEVTEPIQSPEQEKTAEQLPEVDSKLNTEQEANSTTAKNKSNKVLRFSAKAKGSASQRVRKVLKKYPDATLTEIAKRAEVSRSYASVIRSQVQSEQLDMVAQ